MKGTSGKLNRCKTIIISLQEVFFGRVYFLHFVNKTVAVDKQPVHDVTTRINLNHAMRPGLKSEILK